jgi:hypothetical protein
MNPALGRMRQAYPTAGPIAQGDWLGIAFRRGDEMEIYDDIVMGATWGGWVHCEVVRGKGGTGSPYAAFQGLGGFLPSQSRHAPPEWALFALPVHDPAAVHSSILALLALDLPYNSADLWQCCVTAMLPWEAELDCERPETWKESGVFCSQVALLLLRRLARQGAISLPADTGPLVEATHSRGCSPNALFGLLSRACTRVF